MALQHLTGCACCTPLTTTEDTISGPTATDRRRFLGLTTLAAGAAVVAPGLSRQAFAADAEEPHAEYLAEYILLSCMDYRLISHVHQYMDQRGLRGKYNNIVLAGASLGVVMDPHPDWTSGFWDHIDIAVQLHRIRRVMIMDHRDCGAYKVFYKADYAKEPAKETAAHTERLQQLAKQINTKHPALGVELKLMALDGTVEEIPVPA